MPRPKRSITNYGSYERLTEDGLTEWHPAFLQLGQTLQACADRYKEFCQNYKPRPKPEKTYRWGEKMLVGLGVARGSPKRCKGQTTLPWGSPDPCSAEIDAVAVRFVKANAFNPDVALALFE